jgi:hypothetical protein
MSILNDLIRYLRGEYYKKILKIGEFNDLIRQNFEDARASSLINSCKRAYFQTFKAQKSHFREKLKALLPTRAPSQGLHSSLSVGDLVTDLSGSLNQEELSLLGKGPKFAITARLDDTTKLDIQTQLCRLAYQVCWHYKRDAHGDAAGDDGVTTLPKFPQSSFTCVPPSASDEVELALRGSHHDIARLINSTNRDSVHNNLSKKEARILKDLRNKPLTYMPSDKGSEFCVIDNARYKHAGEDHLRDTNIYSKATIAISTIETRANTAWKEVCEEAIKDSQGHPTQLRYSQLKTATILPPHQDPQGWP